MATQLSNTFRPTFETGVPIPASKFGSGRSRREMPFALDALDVGQSAFIPVAAWDNARKNTVTPFLKNPREHLQNYLTSTLRTHRSVKGRKFVTRQQADGVRVWRTL